jgi:hypothetical protein
MIMRSNPFVVHTRSLFFNSYSKSVRAWKSRAVQSINWVHSDTAYDYSEYRMSRVFTGKPELMEEFKTYLYNSHFGSTKMDYAKVFPFKC